MNKSLTFSWFTSIIAVVGSLFFSEVMHFVPCTLCWYQRILMYPLMIILGIAVYQNDRVVYKYVLPFSILGIVVSIYHYSHQKFSLFKDFEMCSSGVPCSGEYINWLGFITIPLLAFVAFSVITVCMLFLKR